MAVVDKARDCTWHVHLGQRARNTCVTMALFQISGFVKISFRLSSLKLNKGLEPSLASVAPHAYTIRSRDHLLRSYTIKCWVIERLIAKHAMASGVVVGVAPLAYIQLGLCGSKVRSIILSVSPTLLIGIRVAETALARWQM